MALAITGNPRYVKEDGEEREKEEKKQKEMVRLSLLLLSFHRTGLYS